MLVVLGVGPALLVVAAMYRLIRTRQRRSIAARDPLSQVLQPHELREMDAHLDVVAGEERRPKGANIAHYVAGEVGQWSSSGTAATRSSSCSQTVARWRWAASAASCEGPS